MIQSSITHEDGNLKISYSTIPGNLRLNNGFGVAGYGVVTALNALGHQVPFKDPTAPVQIHFSQPEWYDFAPGQYKIGYTPWESTELPVGWLEAFNDLDELWTPSPLIASWYRAAGVEVPICLYEHGVDHEWSPVRRRRGETLKFLSLSEPAPRKGGQMAYEAFLEAFGDRTDVHLTIKAFNRSTVRSAGPERNPDKAHKNVSVITRPYETEELIFMFQHHDAFVGNSYGEGFGLPHLQALATGAMTICTEAWAPYKRFLLPELALSSKLIDSPWPHVHRGKMFEPSFDDLVAAYKAVDENYESLAGRSYRNAFQVHKEYDWVNLTRNAFDHIVKKFDATTSLELTK